MKPRRQFVVAALFVVLAALSVQIIAVTLPVWKVSTGPTGDVAQGLFTTCVTDSGLSACWSYSSVEVWLFIVRTLEMMALILLFLAIIAIFVYLLDISWKEILHGMTVVTLLMIVVLIIVGLIIYGTNTQTGLLHVSFSLALIAALLALIAAILLLVGCSCCKCNQSRKKRDNDPHGKVIPRESTRMNSLVIEREPTKAWSEEGTIITRSSSQLSWKSSCKVRPESEIHTEYARTPTQISQRTLTPVKPFHDEKKEPCCKCCRLCCFFTLCKCCHSEKKKGRQREMKTTRENTVCDTCGRDPFQRLMYIDKSTSITSLQQDEITTRSARKQQERTQPTEHSNTTHVRTKTESGQVVMMGATQGSYQPELNSRSTCMTPEYNEGERNQKWNHHRSTPVYCGRAVVANVFNVSPHAPCPLSVYCCRCKHTTQTRSKENKNLTEQINERSVDYLCDCQLGDIRLCDKCIAKRKIKPDVAQNKNQRPKARTVKQNDRANHSNAVIRSKQFPDDEKDTITHRVDGEPKRKHVVLGAHPSSNDDSSEFQPSDNDTGLTTNSNSDRMSENVEDIIDNYVNDDVIYNENQRNQMHNKSETPFKNNVELPSSSQTNSYETPIPSRANGGKKQIASRTDGGKKPISPRTNGDEAPIPQRTNGDETPIPQRTNGDETPIPPRTNAGETPIPPMTNGDETPMPSRTNGGETPIRPRRVADEPIVPRANRAEIPEADDKQSKEPVKSPSKSNAFSGRKPPSKPDTNDSDLPDDSNKQQRRPRILSHNDNQVNNEKDDTKRPKSESNANDTGTTDNDSSSKPRKKRKHKWVPPKWKSHF